MACSMGTRSRVRRLGATVTASQTGGHRPWGADLDHRVAIFPGAIAMGVRCRGLLLPQLLLLEMLLMANLPPMACLQELWVSLSGQLAGRKARRMRRTGRGAGDLGSAQARADKVILKHQGCLRWQAKAQPRTPCKP
mmetsp:Transcript_71211/g.170029  ORF Transcript_71211/g.170029 Transcript_71211/m.170029 type:complete len:137 (-) Transcript_71211:482-892(-)